MNKVKNIITVLLPVVLVFLAFSYLKKNTRSQELKPELVVVNVLDEKLYDDCHIKGSVQLPINKINSFVQRHHKDSEIVVYCSNYKCSTSEYVGKKFLEKGFTNVSIYEGGTAEWYQKGLPVVGPSKSAYLAKVVEEPERKPEGEIKVITAQQLAQKMSVSMAIT